MWKSGALVLGRISKPGGKSGKLALVFEFSTLPTGRHFHGAFHLLVLGAPRRGLLLPAALFAHRLTAHLDALGVVHQPVENAVGPGGIADLLVPLGTRQLAGQDRRSHLIA